MSDDGAMVLPGPEAVSLTFRPRTAYVGFRAFGGGDGAVLLAPGVVRRLRLAAEFAAGEARVAGGLLYGRHWADEQGSYLVVTGFLEAGPGENPGRPYPADGQDDDFTLSEAGLRLLREDAARTYSASVEVGWWRTLEQLGEFGPGDFLTQRDLTAPGDVGLLVYGSGPHWGTAYLGPDGDAPDCAGTLVATAGLPVVQMAPGPAPVADEDDWDDEDGEDGDRAPSLAGTGDDSESPGLAGAGTEPAAGFAIKSLRQPPAAATAAVPRAAGPVTVPPEPEPVAEPPEPEPEPEPVDAAPAGPDPGTAVATRRRAALSPAPRPSAPAVISPMRVPTDEWRSRRPSPGYVGPETPTDVKLVVGGLIIAFIIVAVMIGMLLSSALIAVIAGVVFMLVVLGFVWMSRL
jgi:hypothetical protein